MPILYHLRSALALGCKLHLELAITKSTGFATPHEESGNALAHMVLRAGEHGCHTKSCCTGERMSRRNSTLMADVAFAWPSLTAVAGPNGTMEEHFAMFIRSFVRPILPSLWFVFLHVSVKVYRLSQDFSVSKLLCENASVGKSCSV